MTSPAAGAPADLFASAADLYTRYREPYPQELWDRLVAGLGLDGTQRALDLGAGSGQVAIPLSRHVASVVAVDPSDEMLAAGRAAATEQGAQGIDWRIGDSAGLRDLGLTGLDVATIGRAFHWMDRSAVLADLDAMLAPGAAVALLYVGWRDPKESGFVGEAYRRAAAAHVGPGALDTAFGRVAGWTDHSDVVRASAFSAVEQQQWVYEVERGVDEVVGVTLSYSPTTPRRLGDRRGAFEADLREALLAAEPGGRLRVPVRADLLLARRR